MGIYNKKERYDIGPKPNSSELLRPAVIALVAANLVPVYGVLFLGWKVFSIILLFWLENVVIGVFNVLRMLLADPLNSKTRQEKLFMVPFFCVHYGLFTLGHGLFVMALFGGAFKKGASFLNVNIVPQVVRESHLEWAILGLALSHAVSFGVNYVGQKEYRQASLQALMRQPYGRIVVLHLTIMGSGFLVMLVDSPIVGLLLLVALKIVLDIRGYLRERRQTVSRSVPAV